MNAPRSSRTGFILTVIVAAALAGSAAAWACPETRAAGQCGPPPAGEDTEAAWSEPVPDAGLDAPVLSGVSVARAREPEIRPLENPLGWLLGHTGPKGALRLSAERLSRSVERKPASVSEPAKPAKSGGAKGASPARGGAGSHLAKPHRMPSLEIL